jgi:hypothetical protein
MTSQDIEIEGTIGVLTFWGGGPETSGEVIINIVPSDGSRTVPSTFHVGAVGTNEHVTVTPEQFHGRLVVFMTVYGTGKPLKLRYREIGGSLPEVVWVEGAG